MRGPYHETSLRNDSAADGALEIASIGIPRFARDFDHIAGTHGPGKPRAIDTDHLQPMLQLELPADMRE
jgi:hypothetical protein